MRAAILLAAGEGRRMGRPKALVELRGMTLLEHHLQRFATLGATAVVVGRPGLVLPGGYDAVIVEIISSSPAESLRAGAARLPPSATRIVVAPVDMVPPFVRTYMDLDAALDEGATAVTPRYRGRGGHPVFLRRSALERFVTEKSFVTLRDFLRAEEGRLRVDVDDALVLSDLDTPADLAAYTLKIGAEAIPSCSLAD